MRIFRSSKIRFGCKHFIKSGISKREITVLGGSQLRPNINIKDSAELILIF